MDWVGQVQYSWLGGKADTLDSPKEANTLLKSTRYFLYTRGRPDRALIQEGWIVRAIQHPLREERQSDGRIRRWARVPEMENRAMRVNYFSDTDTTLVEFSDRPPVETRELDENIYLDLDADGHIVSLTVEHAQRTAGMDEFSYQRMPAPA